MDILLSGQLLIAALIIGSIYGLVALGLNLIYGTMRLLNIAYGDLVMIGGYVGYWLFTLAAISPIIAMLVAGVLTGLLGAALYFGLFRRQLSGRQSIERIEANSLLIFFGISIIIQNVTALAFSATPRTYNALDSLVQIGEISITQSRMAALLVCLGLSIFIVFFLRLSPLGLSIRALIQNRTASQIVGIDVNRVQLFAFVTGFALAGLAGALIGVTEQISPFMGFPFTIVAFVVIILGGLGNLAGGLLAGMLLGIIETYGVALTSANLRSILIYGVFILVLVLRPEGLLQKRRMT
ncbi:MAG: branched-chain amino acid ABC transporter permease [Rhodospirillaceae bacterium]|nr:branched-chain amino acid ABC transporter permease [Rhodospirillaceae bacterium]